MLTHIHIENYTIAKTLSLDFENGLSVLTGETGAGKSIILGAINLALGARADTQCIRKGAERCDITLCFDIAHLPDMKIWLQEHALDDEDTCLIRRVIERNGRSRSTLNGKPCPQSLMRQFAEGVLNIHSQHQHQTLLKPEFQQRSLDSIAHHQAMLQKISVLHQQWREIETKIRLLKEKTQTNHHELNLFRYQLEELEGLNLKENEWKTLNEEYQQLHNAKTFLTHLNQALDFTVENEKASASLLLQQAIEQLTQIKTENKQLTNIKTLLDTAAIHLEEAGSELNQYRSQIDISAEDLADKDARLAALHDIARKHQVNPEDLMSVKQSLTEKIDQLENSDAHIEALQEQQAKILKQYQTIASRLTTSRKKAATALNKAITSSMQELGMTGGHFEVRFDAIEGGISPTGNEKVAFWVCTNPGQDPQPIQKIASGGELSRISLALQVLSAKQEKTPTLIFDEVDVGIGGKTAETVGQLLRQLGNETQILCITHLPQVASQGHHHYHVEKATSSTDTSSHIKKLTRQKRIEEIARMLSGSKVTEKTLAHAEDILA